MECYVIYQCVYLILNELIDEKSQDNKIQFLSDANPYIWEGETCSFSKI